VIDICIQSVSTDSEDLHHSVTPCLTPGHPFALLEIEVEHQYQKRYEWECLESHVGMGALVANVGERGEIDLRWKFVKVAGHCPV